MVEDDMDESEAARQHALSRAAASRTVARQVDYGKSMYASGKSDGARKANQALEPLKDALRKVYLLVASAYDSGRFGAQNGDEVKELRREVAGVLGTVGIASPADGRVYPKLDPFTHGAREEREAVVKWLKGWDDVTDDPSLPGDLAADIAAGVHRKGDADV